VKLVFDERALGDIEGIFNWIAKDNPAVAKAVVERVSESLGLLPKFPNMGRVGRDPGTREWVIPRLPYIAVYEVDGPHDQIIITAIFHGAQDRDGDTEV
jgi:addiction module RelE/StbE family toxin